MPHPPHASPPPSPPTPAAPLPPPPPPPPPTYSDGRIGTNWLATITKSLGLSVEPWVRALQGTQFASADRIELVTLFGYLEFCLNQIVMDNELGALREVRCCCVGCCSLGWVGCTICGGPGAQWWALEVAVLCGAADSALDDSQSVLALTVLPPYLTATATPATTPTPLSQALEGQYTEPGPGGDPIRNPLVLPTGKNIHALDPQVWCVQCGGWRRRCGAVAAARVERVGWVAQHCL